MNIIQLKTCESTQLEAQKYQSVDITTLILAEAQTGGIGRSGSWATNPHSYAGSFIFELTEKFLNRVQIIVPLAILQLLEQIEPKQKFCISYPNDIYKNGKKCCGILIQSQHDILIVGIGINIVQCDQQFAKLDQVQDNVEFSKCLHQNILNYLNYYSDTEICQLFFERMSQKHKNVLYNNQCMKIHAIGLPGVIILLSQEGKYEHFLEGSLKNNITQ